MKQSPRASLDAPDASTSPNSQDGEAGGAIVNRTLALDALIPHPRNYNQHTESQLARLRASDRRFGQVRSVVVQEGAPGKYLIVAGHGYIEARRAEGHTEVRADIIPATWSAEQVEGYLVADNELARMSQPDTEMLAQLLQEQQATGFDLLTMGVDETALADLFAAAAPPPTLDSLEREYGDEPAHDAFWPFIRLQVPPLLRDQFTSLLAQAPGATEAEQFAALLACVDLAAARAISPAILAALTGEDTGGDDDADGDDLDAAWADE